MARATPPQVQDHLTGVEYPARKQDLVRIARQNNAPEEVIREVQNLSDRVYGDPVEVTEEMRRR